MLPQRAVSAPPALPAPQPLSNREAAARQRHRLAVRRGGARPSSASATLAKRTWFERPPVPQPTGPLQYTRRRRRVSSASRRDGASRRSVRRKSTTEAPVAAAGREALAMEEATVDDGDNGYLNGYWYTGVSWRPWRPVSPVSVVEEEDEETAAYWYLGMSLRVHRPPTPARVTLERITRGADSGVSGQHGAETLVGSPSQVQRKT